ncbi:HNH endonuclease [Specibacter sp. RAF43]|uniref:HNH endonuclease n=1 Tax=Specibacter sp. RAF43 TaxID=3233057 RepID=UPI003F980C8B
MVNVPELTEAPGGDGPAGRPAAAGADAVGAAAARYNAGAGSGLDSPSAGVAGPCREFVAVLAAAFDAGELARAAREFATSERLAAATPPVFAARGTLPGPDSAAAAVIDAIRQLEDVKNAASAAQARAQVLFASLEKTRQVAAGLKGAAVGRGIGEQIALARRESPAMGKRHLATASRVVQEMPRTLAAWSHGVLNDYRAHIIADGTEFLSPEQRARVDAAIAGHPDELEMLGNKRLATAVKALAYQMEPAAFVKRQEKAASERCVTLRPAADGMTYLSALLPLKHGVRVLKSLTAVAGSARSAGDRRTRGQVMADALVHRLTRHGLCPPGADARTTVTSSAGAAVDLDLCTAVGESGIALDLIMTDRALFDGAADPAILTGYGPIPAPLGRQMVLNTAGRAQVWLQRLYTHPDTQALMAMDAKSRLFPDGMKRFLFDQDQLCSTPWCDAPIRDYDHIKSFADGGTTTPANGQGLCQACNLAKEALGWRSTPTGGDGEGGGEPPGTTITTPTGHTYRARRLPLPGTAPPE